jgi:hypothetical protein
MGTPLTGSTVASTYTGLLKTSDNSALTSALKAIGDGSGIDSALQVSTTSVNTIGDFSVGANKLTVAAASGNTVVGGTLTVTGATSLSGNLAIPGNLSVTGTSTLTGATSVASTLAVTGATSLSSLSTSGAATIGTTLGVTGAATIGTTLGVTGAATVGSTLGVTGASTLASVDVTGAATVGSTLGVTGVSTLASAVITGAATVGSTLGVTGVASLNSVNISGNLSVGSNSTLGNNLNDVVTINSNAITFPFTLSTTVDLANDKVLILDANNGNKLQSIPASELGINASNAPQCVQTLYTDVTPQGTAFVGTNTGSGVEITVLNTTITPRSSSSKVLVSIAVNYAGTNIEKGALRITRNGVEIGSNNIGSSLYGIAPFTGLSPYSSNFFNSQFIQILDSPSTTSAVTYKLHLYSTTFGGGVPSMWLNRTNQDVINNTNSASDARVSSSMTLQEYFA